MENKLDEAFLFGEDKTPEIKSCLMHPNKVAVKTYTTEGDNDFAGVVYGLCVHCLTNKHDDPRFDSLVEATITTRLKELKRSKV